MLIVPVAVVLSQYFFGIAMFLISTFLILLVLVQRGRGGGLAGALGGPGGGSVFGSKAGDVFTKITIITAALWIFTCATGVWWMQKKDNPLSDVTTPSSSSMGEETGAEEPAGVDLRSEFDQPQPGNNLVPTNPLETADPVPPSANPVTPEFPSAPSPTPPSGN